MKTKGSGPFQVAEERRVLEVGPASGASVREEQVAVMASVAYRSQLRWVACPGHNGGAERVAEAPAQGPPPKPPSPMRRLGTTICGAVSEHMHYFYTNRNATMVNVKLDPHRYTTHHK